MPLLLLQPVNAASPVPLYLQVRSILSEAIRTGSLAPGSRLPSTVAIARQLRVSMLTAHHALQQLTRDGWLQRGRGYGTFVRPDFQAALAGVPRFRVVVALRRSTRAQDASAWTCLAGLQSAAAEIVPRTERIVQHYDSAAELKAIMADGMICIRPDSADLPALETMSSALPIVLLGASGGTTSIESVDSADCEGVRSGVRHLVELGHERIVLCFDGANNVTSHNQLCGFMAEMGAHGLQTGAHRVLAVDPEMADEDLIQQIKEAQEAGNGPTAFIAGDLCLALRIRAALQHCGLEVPKDVSLIGFGDMWFAELLSPPMTAIAQPLEAMARQALSRLLQLMSGRPGSPNSEPLPTRLIVRGTTAPPPKTPGRKIKMARMAVTSAAKRRRVRAAGRARRS